MAKIKDKPDTADHGSDQIDFQNDEHRGMGGSYVVDPGTGKRQRVAGPVVPSAQPDAGQIEELNKEI